VTVDNPNKTVTEPDNLDYDPDIDAELNARPGREMHDRAEVAKSTTKAQTTKTVSMDTIFFCRITDWSCQMAWRACAAAQPLLTLPSPLPP
jgi:hypothetical protein